MSRAQLKRSHFLVKSKERPGAAWLLYLCFGMLPRSLFFAKTTDQMCAYELPVQLQDKAENHGR